MDLQLNGKTALVTGATAGIGLAIASTLAREGVAVTITGRDREKLHNAVAKIAQAAPQARVSAIVADLANAEGAEALIKACTDTDILINNLGFYEATPFADITDEEWLRMFNINVMSGVRLSRHYFPRMLARNWGRVIFMSSEVAARHGALRRQQISSTRRIARNGRADEGYRRNGQQRTAIGNPL